MRPFELPPRQSELLQTIARYAQEARSPLVGELIEAMGLAGESSLMRHIVPLERKGLIEVHRRGRGFQRSVGLTEQGRAATQLGIPLIGKIAAGPMILAESEIIDWIHPGNALKIQPGDFLLEVRGDSMIGDGILHGDRVVIRPNMMIGNGEIAAVAEEQSGSGEYYATLKHVYQMPKQKLVMLKASNPKYEDIQLPFDQVRIVGAYKGLLRPL